MPQRRHRKVGHTGSWQGFQTSIQRYPEYDLTVVALSNLGGSSPGPLSEAIAGIVVPELAEPHTLPPDPRPDSLAARAPAALRSLAAGTTDTTLTTRALRRFSGRMWREELAEEIQPVSAWEVVTCDSLPPGLLMYLGSPVVRTCYLRGTGPGASVIATMYYSADHRIAGVEVTSY
jgi:hypothetical protein